MEQISIRYFKIFYTKLPHYVESENNLKYSTPDAACFDICASVAEPYTILPQQRFMCGYKIAQIECPFPYKAVFEEVSPEKFADLAQTIRGNGGFGSTGRR